MRPVTMSANISKSPRSDQIGFRQVAGRFFSNTRWPIQLGP